MLDDRRQPGLAMLSVTLAAALGALVALVGVTVFDEPSNTHAPPITDRAGLSFVAAGVIRDYGQAVVVLGKKERGGRFQAVGSGFFFDSGRVLTTAGVASSEPSSVVDAGGGERKVVGIHRAGRGFAVVSTDGLPTPAVTYTGAVAKVGEPAIVLSLLGRPVAGTRIHLKNVASVAALDGDTIELAGDTLDAPGSAPVFGPDGTMVAVVSSDGRRQRTATARSVLAPLAPSNGDAHQSVG